MTGPGQQPSPHHHHRQPPPPAGRAHGAYPSRATHHPGPHTPHWPAPVRFLPVPDTGYVLGYLPAPSAVSGLAVGALVAGVGATLVSALAVLFGIGGASAGWGTLVAGAVAILTVLLGGGAMGLGAFALRQVRRAPGAVRGRGLALTGVVAGGLGVVLALCAVGGAALIQFG
ncbi:hypothetical protein GCM10010124_02740 [Pilimelia terevasa]|uniref:DUF4190 domain-containing protein n=1 Tax=Pilimelia terevasa TaxID=53372 RepID=A0A8J3BJL0_9ACTN|nr:hypothetical protein [Pilimelia terevasa]GGK13621.1 hypothetical protein GCM10010124_02740 [Pilimelia terevasa]